MLLTGQFLCQFSMVSEFYRINEGSARTPTTSPYLAIVLFTIPYYTEKSEFYEK